MMLGACRITAAGEEGNPSISEIFADKICSGFNQNIVLIIEGPMGSGKSNAALDIAYRTSIEFAVRMGGVPEDYFTIENVAVISAEEVMRLADNLKPFNIYIMDDVAAHGIAARSWQSDTNKVLTGIMQTFRTNNNLLMLTAPSRAFLDKISRDVAHYKINMTANWFRRGLTLGKLSTVSKMYHKDGGNNVYPFIRWKGVVANACYFNLPPTELRAAYEKHRTEIEEEIRKKSIKEFNENREIEAAKKRLAKDKVLTKDCSGWKEEALALKLEHPQLGVVEIGKKVGKDKKAVSAWLIKNNLGTKSLKVTI